jgi:hypothetical protein
MIKRKSLTGFFSEFLHNLRNKDVINHGPQEPNEFEVILFYLLLDLIGMILLPLQYFHRGLKKRETCFA